MGFLEWILSKVSVIILQSAYSFPQALGLAAIMTRAGMYLPCQEGAMISFFSPVVAVMGDDQNLAKGQSTFSSYMTKVHHALEAACIGKLLQLPHVQLYNFFLACFLQV